ncbi:MAG: hypothetical protein EXR93_01305 [Gemmatimonadetes bacterium]|nr:hypothetical protein [Gemmatimonadota bacterium]
MVRQHVRDSLGWHARAPARIDFAGGWTDVPAYVERHGGVVVNAAINRYVQVDVLHGGTGIALHAEDLQQRVRCDSSADIRYDGTLDLHKAALNMFPVTGGIEVLSKSDLPLGSGLGGSGALDVALCAALSRAREELYDKADLAEMGFDLEARELKLLGGRQDQYAAALGGFHELTFRPDAVITRELAVTPAMAADLCAHSVLVYTGQSHFSSKTHERVWRAFEAGEAGTLDALEGIHEAGTEIGARVDAGDWQGVAQVMDDNWRLQQALDVTIATDMTKRIEAAARGAGAWGLKATGAGAGGCLYVLCGPAHKGPVAEAVTTAGGKVIEFAFDFGGVTVWQDEDADNED